MTKYQEVSELGRGGFGIVHKVKNARGELFARKTFAPASYLPPEVHDKLKKRFKREVLTQRELGGAEILPVLECDLDGDSPWFVMPLADRTYESQIADDRASGSVDIDAIADILNGMQYLHDMGYVHRDLNPKNILLHDGNWKLSDLGAVLPPTGHTVTLTEGTIIYTEKYCSPEQRNDFHKAQAPADIYSFGCILHDIYGTNVRVPYGQHRAPGPIGIIIEKCTEKNPGKRPSINVLRVIVLEALVEVGGHCKVEDQKCDEWLHRLESIDSWTDEVFEEFVRFFVQLDEAERTPGNEGRWVYTLSTPFLTRISDDAISKIMQRQDGIAASVAEKYCEWVRNTSFLFHYSDIVCGRLTAMFDNGDAAIKASAFIAMIELAASHNRWYIMRRMLNRCDTESTPKELARRLSIEVRTEEVENMFRRCVEAVSWNRDAIATELRKFCD